MLAIAQAWIFVGLCGLIFFGFFHLLYRIYYFLFCKFSFTEFFKIWCMLGLLVFLILAISNSYVHQFAWLTYSANDLNFSTGLTLAHDKGLSLDHDKALIVVKEMPIGSFDSLTVKGPITVHVKPDGVHHNVIVAKAREDIFEHLQVKHAGHKLEIVLPDRTTLRQHVPEAIVEISASYLKEIVLQGSALCSGDMLSAEQFNLVVAGNSAFKFNELAIGQACNIACSGFSVVEVDKKFSCQTCNISGSGKTDIKLQKGNIKQKLNLSLQGMSDMRASGVHAHAVNVNASGKANIRLGEVAVLNKQIGGSVEISWLEAGQKKTATVMGGQSSSGDSSLSLVEMANGVVEQSYNYFYNLFNKDDAS